MDNALNLIQSWINSSRWKVNIISRSDLEDKCEDILGISEHSTLGTIVNHVGGISAANGAIRHFGGSNKYNLSIKSVNGLIDKRPTRIKGVLVVADDVYGGIFGINYSLVIAKPGIMLYLPPESYTWENLGVGHSAFVNWLMTGDVALFYKKYQKLPVPKEITFDKVVDYNPPLWSGKIEGLDCKYSLIESQKMHKIRMGMLEQFK